LAKVNRSKEEEKGGWRVPLFLVVR
jgi:hypothetical protein